MPEEWVGLGEAVRSLRAELTQATAAGDAEELRFQLGPIELEFSVQVERSAKGTGGVRFLVASASTDGTYARSNAHRVKLQLLPQDRSGSKWNMGSPER